MANLRGGNYEKQINSAFHKLEAFGIGRHGLNSHKTHSDGLAKKREMYLNDYKLFAESSSYTDKLNKTMTPNNMDRFFNQRLENLSLKSRTDYIRGWSSMVQGLKEANITISIDKNYFDKKVADIKASEVPSVIKTDKAIPRVENVIKELYNQRYESGVISEVQYKLGVRVSEAIELISNYEQYISNNEVIGLIGKGNHIYNAKTISHELIVKIKLAENIPHQNTYRNDLSKVTDNRYTPHSFRYNYAKKQFEQKVKASIPYKQILREVSEGLNHSREEMTNYYLKRT